MWGEGLRGTVGEYLKRTLHRLTEERERGREERGRKDFERRSFLIQLDNKRVSKEGIKRVTFRRTGLRRN